MAGAKLYAKYAAIKHRESITVYQVATVVEVSSSGRSADTQGIKMIGYRFSIPKNILKYENLLLNSQTHEESLKVFVLKKKIIFSEILTTFVRKTVDALWMSREEINARHADSPNVYKLT